MSDFGFGRPLWLLLAPLALALIPLALTLAERSVRRARALTRHPPKPRRAATVALALAVALAAVAAAQPRWGERTVALPSGGTQLVAVLDVSRSMGVADVAPSRLAAARAAIADAFRGLSGDRAALVVFAGDARVRFPLTRDLAVAATVVESVEGGTLLLGRGTSAAAGLDLARELFDDADARSGRLVLLVSDGDDLAGDAIASAAALADAGIALLVAGAGTSEGGVVPVFDPVSGERSALTDAGGAPIVSRLDESRLRAIAEAAGGRYLGTGLAGVPGSVRARLAALEGGERDPVTVSLPVERFQWFAAAALTLALLGTAIEWRALPRWRYGAALAAAAVPVALLAAACATAAHDLNERARASLAAGDVDAAVALLYEARAEDPANGRIVLNLAAALHRAERYDEGAFVAGIAARHRDPAIAAAGHASLGRHRFAQGALEEALAAFEEALLHAPEDDAARRDYEVVYRLLQSAPPEVAPAPAEAEADPPEGEPPEPGESQPGAGADGAAASGGDDGGDAGGGERLAPAALEEQLAAIDAQVDELRGEGGETLSAEEARDILELLAERARLAARNAIRARWNDAGDY